MCVCGLCVCGVLCWCGCGAAAVRARAANALLLCDPLSVGVISRPIVDPDASSCKARRTVRERELHTASERAHTNACVTRMCWYVLEQHVVRVRSVVVRLSFLGAASLVAS